MMWSVRVKLFSGFLSVFADVNECEDNRGDCEHHCINEVGGYRCTCKEGFKLRGDNRTCESETTLTDTANMHAQAAHRDRCYANCETVHRLHDKLKALQEKVNKHKIAIERCQSCLLITLNQLVQLKLRLRSYVYE